MALFFQKFGLLLLLAALFNFAYSATDNTLVEWAQGRDVVEAVIKKIYRSEIFLNDNSFLLRLAYVESRFGEDNTTFRQDYFGGIWQVEESVFRITQTNHSSLFPLHQEILSKFQVDWAGVTWKHLVTPLYSGLAAALYFARVPEAIPQTVSDLTGPPLKPGQATHWVKYYRPLGDVPKFVNDSEELRNQTKCRGKMDLCIVLDGSGSINQVDKDNFQRAKNFTADLISSFSLDFTRVGMIVFSNTAQTIFEINNRNNISYLAQLARNATYPGQNTYTDIAIRRAIQMFNTSSNGDNSVPRVMTVFTDGQSNNNITDAVSGIRNNSIKSVSIGIGHALNQEELLLIALNDSDSVFTIDDFSGLQDFVQKITSVACEVPQTPSFNTSYDDTLVQSEKRYYQIKSPLEGITINVTVTIGKTSGYWSHSEEAPSAAIHDGTIDGPATFIPAPASAKQDDGTASLVYFTIQGVEDNNNYTLTMDEGNKVGGGGECGGGAGISSLANYAIILWVIVQIGLN